MTMAGAATRRYASANSDQPAELLPVLGITGDLARAMRFRSLHRLEQRKPLWLPIVGVRLTSGR